MMDDTQDSHQTLPPVPGNGSGRHPVLGCMSGTVTVADDLDLTAPAMPEWVDMVQDTAVQT